MKELKVYPLSLGVGFAVGLAVGILVMVVFSGSLPFLATSQKHVLRIRIDPNRSGSTIIWHHVTVDFTKDDKFVTAIAVRTEWQNVTLEKGEYVLKVYDGQTGEYLRSYEISLVRDTDFEMVL